jgi:hypothetical protein
VIRYVIYTQFTRWGWLSVKWALPAVAVAYFIINCSGDWSQQRAIRQPASYAFAGPDGQALQFPLPPVFVDPDSVCWLVYAHTLVERGEFRLRTSPIGNAPDGRPMLWAHLYLWWVTGLGGIAALLGHSSWIEGIDKAIFWSNPLAFVLFATAWFALVQKYAGTMAAALGLLFLCASPSISADFASWHPDHHGFHLAAMLGALTAAVVGVQLLMDGASRDGRRLLVWAGVAGGFGLWIGATEQVTVVFAIGVVGLAGAFWIPRDRLGDWDSAWMAWATAGGSTSLFGFMVEFFPDFSAARLEAIHPMFAAAWFGGGLLIRGVCRGRSGASNLSHLLVGCFLIAILPTSIFLAPLNEYSLRDPMVLRWNTLIAENQPAWNTFHLTDALREFSPGLLLIPAGVWLLWRRRRDQALLGSLGLLLIATLGFAALTIAQRRWASFFEACLVLLAVWLTRYGGLWPAGRRFLVPVLAACVALSISLMSWDITVRFRGPPGIRPDIVTSIGTRDLAVTLRRANSGRTLNVIADSTLGPGLYAYGGIGALAALYWENAPGMRAAAEILVMQDDAEAERVVRAHQVTHFVIEASPFAVMSPRWIALGLRDPEGARRSLAWRLAKPEPSPPAWLRLESEQKFLGRDVPTRIYRVIPPP